VSLRGGDLSRGSIRMVRFPIVLLLLAGCGRRGFESIDATDVDSAPDAPTTTPYLYWIDAKTTIRRMRLDGSDLTTVLATSATCLGHDAVSKKIYWCGGNQILRAGYAGEGMETVVAATVGYVPTIEIDPSRGHVYWSQYSMATGLYRTNLDGTNQVQLFTISGIQDYELSADGTRLYYAMDIGNDRVSYLGLDGAASGDVFAVGASGIVNPDNITLDDSGHLFWLDSQAGKQKIQRLLVDGTQPLDIVTDATVLLQARGILYFAPTQRVYWATSTGIFGVDANGGGFAPLALPMGSAPEAVVLVNVPD
jgi:hypothetical protein